MKNQIFKILAISGLILLLLSGDSDLFAKSTQFKVLVLTERGGQHEGFVVAALDWLKTYSAEKNFEITVINHATEINETMLAKYKVFIQLNYPPYTWSKEAEAAFIKYIEEGRGGWVGFHHATLLGEFDGYPMWNWFSGFMGGIRFDNYVAATASGMVRVEDAETSSDERTFRLRLYLLTTNGTLSIQNPRPNVHVLANVDESTYQPDFKQ